MKKRGFTLIELLVVIAIIAILAAILFPVFLTAKERGRQAKCCSNLKQITMAMFGYADDNNGGLPVSQRSHIGGGAIEWTGSKWTGGGSCPLACDVREGSLYKGGYARNVWVFNCPSDMNIPCTSGYGKVGWAVGTSGVNAACLPPGGNPNGLPSGFGVSYSMNEDLCDKLVAGGGRTTIKLSAATAGRTGQVLMLLHEKRGDSMSNGQNDGYFQWWSFTSVDLPGEIHWKGTTCSYADGHVKWISNGEMVRIESQHTGGVAPPANVRINCSWHRNSFFYGYGSPDSRYAD
jgi:prepilin-type N-terminal cleavage/methylation domain-containing protein